jgi:homospermidine synthase
MNTKHTIHTQFNGRVVMVGFGCLGRGVLPLILRHIGGVSADKITVVTAENVGLECAHEYGVKTLIKPLTPDNYEQVLRPLLSPGDFLLNLSVDVASLSLIRLAADVGALYLDTCIEPWAGGYVDTSKTPSGRSNYELRAHALALREQLCREGKNVTAVLTHGANPGMVSHLLKQALLNVANDTGLEYSKPRSREEWARLSQRLGVKVVHIAERDNQIPTHPKQVGEFVNTWSVDGFVSEGAQPAELGWGTHEKALPHDGREHEHGSKAAIYLMQPGAATRVRTWTPTEGPFHGFLITHSEAISIADYFTVTENGKVVYRPTSHYAYHPSDSAVSSVHEFVGKNYTLQPKKRILLNEIASGIDELGVLIAGHGKNAYWYGSQLSIDEARRLAPYNSATSLQVTSAALAGMIWAIENPTAGIVEPDEMDFERNLEIIKPYLGPVVGAYTDWTPLEGRGELFPEDLDRDDPWQFKNIRVI